jgi:hypothetical protein
MYRTHKKVFQKQCKMGFENVEDGYIAEEEYTFFFVYPNFY